MKTKRNFEVGKKYRGYGYLNEYGEFEFIPENTGSRQGITKKLKEGEDFSVSTTSKYVLVHIRLERPASGVPGVQKLMKKVDNVLKVLLEYDI